MAACFSRCCLCVKDWHPCVRPQTWGAITLVIFRALNGDGFRLSDPTAALPTLIPRPQRHDDVHFLHEMLSCTALLQPGTSGCSRSVEEQFFG